MTVRTAPPLSDARSSSFGMAPFEVLDGCHQEMIEMLGDLRRLMAHVAEQGLDDTARALARNTHLFFTTTAVNHHLDEERHVFPALLRSDNASLRSAIHRLQQDHAWLESRWMALAPRLDYMARGHQWHDMTDVNHHIEGFTGLYQNHIALEESLIYPPARAQLSPDELHTMSREMAERRNKPRATDHIEDRSNGDDD
ncbi:MAG: hemerythrin domain-containing protein [Pseudomonadota bacterium]